MTQKTATCEPGSKLVVLGMAIPPLIGNPYNGYINPYYWVDDHPLLYGNNGSLDNPDVRASLSSVVTWPLTQVVGTNHNKQQKYQSPRDNIFSVITGGMKRRCTSKKNETCSHTTFQEDSTPPSFQNCKITSVSHLHRGFNMLFQNQRSL